MNLSIKKQMSDAARQAMESGLLKYETDNEVSVNFQPIIIEVKNEFDQIIGVMDAFQSYSSVYINDLWVDEHVRGQGYGRQMMMQLEHYASERQLDHINTVSCAFQAPEFYQKCGFELEFVRENTRDPKLSMYFLIKWLNRV